MLSHKLRLTALTAIVLGALASTAGYLAFARTSPDEPRHPALAQQTPVDSRTDDANPKPAPGRMFLVGRVLDPQGELICKVIDGHARQSAA